MDSPEQFRRRIYVQDRIIRDAQRQIRGIAKESIPEFHFLNHEVSTFYECDKSPIGLCVWDVSEKGLHIDCHCYYCGNPVERN